MYNQFNIFLQKVSLSRDFETLTLKICSNVLQLCILLDRKFDRRFDRNQTCDPLGRLDLLIFWHLTGKHTKFVI